ncbi:MAG: hypothetical protein QXH42_06550 [Thermoplasmata archaeon]
MRAPREIAHRLFAEEFNSSTVELEPEGEFSPGHVLTPLGLCVNRVLVVGVITDVENISTSGEPLWRARLSDPTETYYISAGKYSPEAAGALARITPPAFAAVVGKVRVYRPEEGVVYLSLKAETVVPSTAALRDYWVLEACRSLKKRIELAEEAMGLEKPTVEALVSLGASRSQAEGLILALQRYGPPDLERFRAMLESCLRYVLPEMNGRAGEEEEAFATPGEKEGPGEMASEEAEEPGDDEVPGYSKEEEAKVIKIVESLQTGTKGAPWEKIVERAKKEGLSKETVDQIVMDLMESGVLYEPSIGRIRKT